MNIPRGSRRLEPLPSSLSPSPAALLSLCPVPRRSFVCSSSWLIAIVVIVDPGSLIKSCYLVKVEKKVYKKTFIGLEMQMRLEPYSMFVVLQASGNKTTHLSKTIVSKME
jgi:hypothetical protein